MPTGSIAEMYVAQVVEWLQGVSGDVTAEPYFVDEFLSFRGLLIQVLLGGAA